ncbi:hypothetical protein D7V82_21425 [bacterium 1xD8-6]|nr:hypothetical protein D7V72_12545 [bacterium D16-36]RKI62934.1 hypothetical protein D7V82_21425 [bacterium 1xD8-6]
MLALLGTIQGNTIVVENDSITNYDGKEVILTIHIKGLGKKLIGISMVWNRNVENMLMNIWRK